MSAVATRHTLGAAVVLLMRHFLDDEGGEQAAADSPTVTMETDIYRVLDSTRDALGDQGIWVSNDAVMQLVLSGEPGFDPSLDVKPPLLFEDVVEEYFFNAQEWHWLQRRMVYGIGTLHLLRVLYLVLNPSRRRRHLEITKERCVRTEG